MDLKSFLKHWFRTFLSLAGLAWIFPGFVVAGNKLTLPFAAIALTLINLLIKPILKLVLLPLNLISFGMFRWVITLLTLLLLTVVIEQVHFAAFVFPGFNQYGIILPQIHFSRLGSLVTASFLLTFIRKAIVWLSRSDD